MCVRKLLLERLIVAVYCKLFIIRKYTSLITLEVNETSVI